MEVRTGKYVSRPHVHWAFMMKLNRKLLPAPAIRDLEGFFAQVCCTFDPILVMSGIEEGDVYLLAHYFPRMALVKFVNSPKCVSNHKLQDMHPEVAGGTVMASSGRRPAL